MGINVISTTQIKGKKIISLKKKTATKEYE